MSTSAATASIGFGPGDSVLVTGCSSGIGRALVIELSRRGFGVVASARRLDSLSGLTCARCIELDVTSEASIAAAEGVLRNVDVLVNNAGVSLWGPLEAVPAAEARRLFDTNFFGALRLCQAALPGMRARARGLIVQISSTAARSVSPLLGYYCASKAALEAASEALRLELTSHGVRVSCISVGAVASSIGSNRRDYDDPAYERLTVSLRARLEARRRQPTSSQSSAAMIADCIVEGGRQFRYDGTPDAGVTIERRRSLSDEQYEAQVLREIAAMTPGRP